MKAAVKELHDQMMGEERGMKADQRQLRGAPVGSLADQQIGSLSAALRASRETRRAMRNGGTLRALEAYTLEKAQEAADYPPFSEKIRAELFYVTCNARKYAQAAGETLPPIFQDWGKLAGELDEIARAFEQDGSAAATFGPSDRRGYDLRISRAAVVSGYWNIAGVIETHRREAERGGLETAAVMEAALQWYAQHGRKEERRDEANNYLRTVYEERASEHGPK